MLCQADAERDHESSAETAKMRRPALKESIYLPLSFSFVSLFIGSDKIVSMAFDYHKGDHLKNEITTLRTDLRLNIIR